MDRNPSHYRYVRLGIVWLGVFLVLLAILGYLNQFLEIPLGAMLLISSLGGAVLVYWFQKYVF